MAAKKLKLQGYALMDKDYVRECGRRGGQKVQRERTGYRWTVAQAQANARAGGLASQAARRKREEHDNW